MTLNISVFLLPLKALGEYVSILFNNTPLIFSLS